MYIKLGNIETVYTGNSYSDFMIVSEIVDSKLSYEKPTLIRSIQELDIWFGKDFKDYSYLKELLEDNVTLYLYRPLLKESDVNIEEELNINNYTEEPEIYYRNTSITLDEPNLKSLPKIGEKFKIYQVLVENNEERFDYEDGSFRYNKMIWYCNQYVNKNIILTDINSNSLNNRDTLFLSKDRYCTPEFIVGDLGFTYSYIFKNNKWNPTKLTGSPKYRRHSIKDVEFIPKENDTLVLEIPYLEDIVRKDDLFTLAWKIDWTSINDSYIVFKEYDGSNVLFYSTKDQAKIDKIVGYLKCKSKKFKNQKELEGLIDGLGYKIKGNYIYSLKPTPITYFEENIKIEPSYIESQHLMYESSKEDNILKFWSKTIGYDSDKISVTINKLSSDNYRVVLEKCGYIEEFEGSFSDIVDKERLDYLISKRSKLVYCEVLGDVDIDGSWILDGATTEIGDFEYNLQYIKNSDLPIDFLLCPNKNTYNEEDLLKFSKEVNCQVLIQNNGEDYRTNILDKENRLIYFYNDLKYFYEDRPGYYIYLKGLLSGIFSDTSDSIIYDSPQESKEKELEKYKSNYLTDNGQYYFYKTFLDGNDYITTGWMRFAISKISREFEKSKWELIGSKINRGKIENRISKLLNNLVDLYSIIYSIEVNKFKIIDSENKVELSITTKINDLVKSDLTLDLTINYKIN